MRQCEQVLPEIMQSLLKAGVAGRLQVFGRRLHYTRRQRACRAMRERSSSEDREARKEDSDPAGLQRSPARRQAVFRVCRLGGGSRWRTAGNHHRLIGKHRPGTIVQMHLARQKKRVWP